MSAIRLFDKFQKLLDVTWGSIADGNFLKRSGLNIVGTLLTKGDVGLSNVDNVSDASKPVSTAQQTALNLKQDTSAKGAVSGYASLDAGGKVPTAQLPAAALSTGTVVGPGTTVAAEIASYADTTGNLLARITPPAGALVGTTGAQTLSGPKTLTSPIINTPTGIVKGDVGLGNVDNTSDANKPVSTAQATADALKEDKANKAVANGYASLDATGKVPSAQLPVAGGGDVVGPAAAVDGDVTVFSGTTGKIIKTTSVQLSSLATTANANVLGQASSVDSEVALFSGTGGKTIKRATGTGMVTVVNGVYQTPAGKFPRNHLVGLVTSNTAGNLATHITIGTGECRDSTNVDDLVLASTLTKRVDTAWAVGTNNGGLDTGTVSATVVYHLWLIKRPDTGVVDALFSLSATAPTMPANYTLKRRIMGFWRVSSVNTPYFQQGDQFWLSPEKLETSGMAYRIQRYF